MKKRQAPRVRGTARSRMSRVTFVACFWLMTSCATTSQVERLQIELTSLRRSQEQRSEESAEKAEAFQAQAIKRLATLEDANRQTLERSAHLEQQASQQAAEWQKFQSLYEPELRKQLKENLAESTDHRKAVANLLEQSRADSNSISQLKKQSERDRLETERNARESQTQNVVNQFNNLRQAWMEFQQKMSSDWSTAREGFNTFQSNLTLAWAQYQTALNKAWSDADRNLSAIAGDSRDAAKRAADDAERSRTMMAEIRTAAQKIESYSDIDRRVRNAQETADRAQGAATNANSAAATAQTTAERAWTRAANAPTQEDLNALRARLGQCCRPGNEHER